MYESEGTEAQMRAWIKLADEQLARLAEERAQLDDAMTELRKMRDDTATALEG